MEDDIFVACCIIKGENELKYNLSDKIERLSGSAHLLQGTNVTGS